MGIMFLEKNKIDLDRGTAVTIDVTDAVATDTGDSYVDYLRNRDNVTGWSTTDSTDAANTQMDIAIGESVSIDRIKLHGINWKAYTIQYWNGSAYTSFSTPIAETVNASENKFHSFTSVETDRIRIIITGTMTVNDDKRATQIILTEHIGTFTTQPEVTDLVIGRKRRQVEMLSGKKRIQRGIGAVSMKLYQECVINTSDLTLLESLFDYHNGFLVWICGNDTSVFRTQRQGYREQDVYLMMQKNEYAPVWREGNFNSGTPIELELVEVV